MQSLELSEVERIVNLLARAGDPTVELSLPDRKRMLLEGVAELVAADIWIWSNAAVNPAIEGDGMATFLIDGGYRNELERAAFYGFLADPNATRQLVASFFDDIRNEQCLTRLRTEIVTDCQWEQLGVVYRAAGLADCLLSFYAVGPNVISGVGFHRRHGKPEFTVRDRAIVHVIFQQVDWLHRHGTNLPAGKNALQLSPRERQVLVFLLGGDSLKEVANKLTLSEHTVANYVKEIYRSFSVRSRAELLSLFLAGGQVAK